MKTIKNLTKKQLEQIVVNVYGIATRDISYLSSSSDYSRGYRDGIFQAYSLIEDSIAPYLLTK